MYISRDKFTAYEEVRYSGGANMFDLDKVLELNKVMSEVELKKIELHYIMRNYARLSKRFGYVKVQSV